MYIFIIIRYSRVSITHVFIPQAYKGSKFLIPNISHIEMIKVAETNPGILKISKKLNVTAISKI